MTIRKKSSLLFCLLAIISFGILVFLKLSNNPSNYLVKISNINQSPSPTINPYFYPTPQISPTAQKFIDVAKNFLVQKLGNSFYDKHVTNLTSQSYKDCLVYHCNTRNQIVFHTNLPVVLSGAYDIGDSKFLNMSDLIYIDVNDSSEIIHYYGPAKDFSFAITKNQVKKLSEKYNLVPVTDAVLIIYRENTRETIKTFTPSWLVFGASTIPQKGWDGKTYLFRKIIYVDTDTGNKLEEATICLSGLGDSCPPPPE